MADRFAYSSSDICKERFDKMVEAFDLNLPPNKADLVHPEKSNMEVINEMAGEIIRSIEGVGVIGSYHVGAILQRVARMDQEIKNLRRNNRNLRSKNKRLQERKNG